MSAPTKTGMLYGVGVGPGDPELLTVKAVACLRACPVVAYPAPLDGESLARRIAAPYLQGAAKTEIAIRIPLHGHCFDAPESYAGAARSLVAHLERGTDVAVLCLGDPLLYGSFVYVLHSVRAHDTGGLRFCVIPGITAVTAAAGVAGTALAMRDETLCVIPATLEEDALAARIAASEAMIFIKVGHHLEKLRRVLTQAGLVDQAVYVERASFDDQKYQPLAHVDATQASYFSIVLVRRHAALWR